MTVERQRGEERRKEGRWHGIPHPAIVSQREEQRSPFCLSSPTVVSRGIRITTFSSLLFFSKKTLSSESRKHAPLLLQPPSLLWSFGNTIHFNYHIGKSTKKVPFFLFLCGCQRQACGKNEPFSLNFWDLRLQPTRMHKIIYLNHLAASMSV